MNATFKRIVNIVTLSSFLVWNLAVAAPEGGSVAQGSAAISQSGTTTTINQSSQNAVINWTGFNTASNESVQFNQLNASSIALNRINSGQPTTFAGALSANGQVWIVNPNGILFASTSQVDVAGLLATTHDIADANFMAGHYKFDIPGVENSKIINNGLITARDSGIVALVAPGVENNGVITAHLGKVHLASGSAFVLDMNGDQLINFGSSPAVQNGYVKNAGRITANGGKVYMTAHSAARVLDNVISMSGVIEAKSVSTSKGTIVLHGGNAGKVRISGTLDASTGGFIETSGESLVIESTADINPGKGGTWFIDPWQIDIDETLAALISADLSNGVNVSLYACQYLYVLAEILQELGSDYAELSLGSGYYLEVSAPITLNNGALSLWADSNINIYSTLNLTNGEHSIETDSGDIGIYAPINVFNSYMGIYAGSNVYIESPITAVDTYLSVGTGEPQEGGGNVYIDALIMMTDGTVNISADDSIYINAPITVTEGGMYFDVYWGNIYINTLDPIVSDYSQYYYGDVILDNDAMLTSNFGNIYFYDTVNSGWCMETAANLTINVLQGFVKFRDEVGTDNPLNNLVINGLTKFRAWCDDLAVITVLSQIYNGAVTSNTDMLLLTIENGGIFLNSGYSAPDNQLVLVTGANSDFVGGGSFGNNINVYALIFGGTGSADLTNTTINGFSGADAFAQVILDGATGDHYCVNGVGVGSCITPLIFPPLDQVTQAETLISMGTASTRMWDIIVTDMDGNVIEMCNENGCVMAVKK